MNQRQFVKQGLTPIQIKMAAILYAVNGYDNAAEFVADCKLRNEAG